MKLRTSLVIQFGILVASIVVSAYYNQKLPDIVPTHWNFQGQADQHGSKWQMLLLGPGMVATMILLTLVLPRISPKNFEIDQFVGTFSYAMVLVSALMFFLGIICLRATNGTKFDFGRDFMAGLFLFFALIGNVLGKVRRNFYMGIRTPWTLASERVWDATHRLAGYFWVAGGLVGAGLALLGMPLAGSITLLVILGLWPVVQSYLLYQKLER